MSFSVREGDFDDRCGFSKNDVGVSRPMSPHDDSCASKQVHCVDSRESPVEHHHLQWQHLLPPTPALNFVVVLVVTVVPVVVAVEGVIVVGIKDALIVSINVFG